MVIDTTVTICRLIDLPDQGEVVDSVRRIFFASAGPTTFSTAELKSTFEDRWLGRYLDGDRRWAHVAVAADRTIIGYVVGSHDDPAQSARFADIPYFSEFADVTARYPAHLHINLDEMARNRGIGGQLIERFVDDVRAAGLLGVHVVTGKTSRNVRFYARERFTERATGTYNGNPIVLLGREVANVSPSGDHSASA